jgi:hypothetical protein
VSTKYSHVGSVPNISHSYVDVCSKGSLPPIFDMGDNLIEGESDIFSIGKIIDQK